MQPAAEHEDPRARTLERRRLGRLLRYSGGLALFLLIAFALPPLLTKALFLRLPAPSDVYDCDDGALAMLGRLAAFGIEATPVVGDFGKTGEECRELTHVWLIAEIAGMRIALDWGTPWFDRQHYEGHPITRAKLLEFVEGDL